MDENDEKCLKIIKKVLFSLRVQDAKQVSRNLRKNTLKCWTTPKSWLLLGYSAWSPYMRYHIGNHRNDCLLHKLHENAFLSVVYFNMEKMLLYWSMDQYNNVQKCVERKESAMLPDGRKGLTLHQ